MRASVAAQFSFALCLWFLSGLVSGHYVHTVTVGQEGSFFNPAVIAAQKDDIVSFVFVGDQHGVVQSDPASPCAPKQGGFNSGFAGRRGNGSATPQTWDLFIDDPSSPIWFFCPSVQPSSHCNAGMVGVINVPAIEAYDDFVANAKGFRQTPAPTPTITLQGVGAHATNSPAIPVSSTDVAPSSLVSSTTSSPASSNPSSSSQQPPVPAQSAASSSSPPSSSSSKSNAGAIAGGVIGGLAALALLAALAFFGRRWLQRSKRESRTFFDYQGASPVIGQYQDRAPSMEQPSTISAPASQQSQQRSRNLFSMP